MGGRVGQEGLCPDVTVWADSLCASHGVQWHARWLMGRGQEPSSGDHLKRARGQGRVQEARSGTATAWHDAGRQNSRQCARRSEAPVSIGDGSRELTDATHVVVRQGEGGLGAADK
jgi:hypothetical protein